VSFLALFPDLVPPLPHNFPFASPPPLFIFFPPVFTYAPPFVGPPLPGESSNINGIFPFPGCRPRLSSDLDYFPCPPSLWSAHVGRSVPTLPKTAIPCPFFLLKWNFEDPSFEAFSLGSFFLFFLVFSADLEPSSFAFKAKIAVAYPLPR